MDYFVNNKKKLISLLVFGIIMVVLGVSYAWFNYYQEGRNKKLLMGDIYLTLNEGNDDITLENVFPMTKEEARASQDNFITFTLSGLNESSNDIYYEIKLKYGDEETGLDRFNDKDLVFDLVEVGQNNEETYIVDAKSFDSIDDKKIWVDTVNHNTTTEVVKTYKLRVWLSDQVIISDSDPNRSYCATDNCVSGEKAFKNHYASVKLSVFGDFKEKELDATSKLIKMAQVKNDINFGNISSDTNGKGLYKLGNTNIVYYRGEVDNNNVIFGGFCWQIVRTTDTGGIKMIYNGIPDITGSGDNITYDCGTTREFQNDVLSTTDLSSSTGYYYADDYEIVSTEGNGVTYKLKSKVNQITQVPITSSNVSTNIATIVTDYPYTCKKTTETETCTVLYKVESYASGTNANVYASDGISTIGNSVFNTTTYQSMSDVGYMYNKRYEYSYTTPKTGAYFGSGVSYNEETNTYTLTGADVTTPDASHHYSCDLTDPAGSCATVRYYYYVSGVNYYHIKLTDGEKIEDAIYKMTGNGTNEVKARAINQNYELNTTNSTIKTVIDTWYQNNLTSYTNYLEDTIYCNDRSFQENGSNTLLKSGWNPNANNTTGNGGLTTYIYFNARTRFNNSYWYNTTNVPVFTCPKEEDRFTVSSEKGNRKLTYPIGLLTSDEIILAGATGNAYTSNNKYYLNTGSAYWVLSPSNFYNINAVEFYVRSSGSLDGSRVHSTYGARPVVSLKSGTEFESGGDGTSTKPYVVKTSS